MSCVPYQVWRSLRIQPACCIILWTFPQWLTNYALHFVGNNYLSTLHKWNCLPCPSLLGELLLTVPLPRFLSQKWVDEMRWKLWDANGQVGGRGHWNVTTLLQTEGEPSPGCHFDLHIFHHSLVKLIFLSQRGKGVACNPLAPHDFLFASSYYFCLPSFLLSFLPSSLHPSLPPFFPSPLHSAVICQLFKFVLCDCFNFIWKLETSFYYNSSSVIF